MADGTEALSSAKELMDNYWDRHILKDEYGQVDYQADSLARIAEQLTITNYALLAIAERGR